MRISSNDRPATWRELGIPTRAVLENVRRRADRRQQGVANVLAAMQDGASLQLQFIRGREHWRLSSGAFVLADVAAVVIARPEVMSCGDTLFAGLRGQTWRLAE